MSIPLSFLYPYGRSGLISGNGRFEIPEGYLSATTAPGTRHQAVSLRMAIALLKHIEARNLGRVFQAPYGAVLSRETVIQPDILFVRRERRGMIGPMSLQGAPDLVIEILSQSTREVDLTIKRKIYSRFEIPEYWIVDPGVDTVEVLVWSEMGYASAGVYGKSERLSSPLLPLNLHLSRVFKAEYT